jgi:hypothetical protein
VPPRPSVAAPTSILGGPAPPAATTNLPPGAVPGLGTAPATPSLPPGAAPALGTTPVIGPIPYPAAAAPLVPLRPIPAAEADPYDALGIRVGTFIFKPAIDVTSGYDTNPARVPDGRASWFYTIGPELSVRSDWERHQLNADLHSSFIEYPDVRLANRPNVDAKVDGRIDMTRNTEINLEARYLLSTDYPGSPNLPVGIARLPIFEAVGGTAGVTQRFNRLEVSLKGGVDRYEYQDSQLLDGTSFSNKDRDYIQYAAALRGSYEVTPGIKPFAELVADTRIHDLEVDRSGNRRDSVGFIPNIGGTFELTRKLTGEIAVGYIDRVYEDPLLPDVRGLIVNGSLVWTATALTSVKLAAKSTVDESVVPGISGILRRDIGIEVNHSFRRWLIGSVRFGFGLDQYVGSSRVDQRYVVSAGLAYKLTRSIQIRGEVREEWLHSNVAGVDYTATIALVGLRLQQ